VVNFTPRPLYPRGKSPRYPLDRRLDGPQSRSGRFGEEKILDPTGTRIPDPSVVQLVASRYTDYAIPAPILGAEGGAKWTSVLFCRLIEFYEIWCSYASIIEISVSRQPSGLRYEMFSLGRTQGPWFRIPLRAWMFSVCVACAFCCVCVQVEALRGADHASKDPYRLS
jgi:hypothetical protein